MSAAPTPSPPPPLASPRADSASVPTSAHILICDDLDAVAHDVFRRRGFRPEIRTGMSESELCDAVRGADAVIVRSATKITRAVLEAADRLKVVGRAGIGVDNVDCRAATERGVVVMNTPTGNATTTAELAIALLCSLARHVPLAARRVREGSWKKKGLVGTELTGKTLGVVGLGRIGRLVAERAQGLELRVVAHDPYLQANDAGSPVPGVELLELDELLARSDFVTLHVPLTDSTRNLISWERLARIKPGARLINASRGGVVDEEAVLDALEEGRLAGAAFDVLEQEPPAPGHPLVARDDVIVTPHLGASSEEAQYKVAEDIAEQIADFLTQGIARNAVNAPVLPPQAMQEMAPFFELAEKMGSLLAQRIGEPIRKLELTVGGEIARHDPDHLGLALVVGVLRETLGANVNFVNAPLFAKERGIRQLHTVDDDPYFRQGQLKARASVRGGGRSHLVAGTVFGRVPRFVRIDDVHLDLPVAGPLLITRHRDLPGVVGQLGTVLGNHGVNIRRIELGPPSRESGGLAAGFLTLYDVPPDAVVDELAALEPVEEVQLIHL